MRTGSFMSILACVLLIASPVLAVGDDGAGTRAVRPDRGAGTSAAVVVPAGASLLFSSQVVAGGGTGGDATPKGIADEALDRLGALLGSAGSGLDRAVRIHAVIDGPELLPALREALADRFADRDGPALTVVEGGLPRPGARIALDAVATTDRTEPGRIARSAGPVSVLPGGPRVFISGQAEPGDDLATATRETLEGLRESLDHLGLGTDRVVQLKAFFLPPESAEVVEREVVAFFEGAAPPPLVLVEWESNLPIEIELVAAAPGPVGDGFGDADGVIEYRETPSLAASPVFSRIARVDRGDLVFVSGLSGPEGFDGEAQVEAVFGELAAILDEAGSDFDHLAKATYYVSDDDSSAALNALRPNYYDPSRPPAASKAMVPGVGLPGRSLTIDMIAVVPGPAGGTP